MTFGLGSRADITVRKSALFSRMVICDTPTLLSNSRITVRLWGSSSTYNTTGWSVMVDSPMPVLALILWISFVLIFTSNSFHTTDINSQHISYYIQKPAGPNGSTTKLMRFSQT